MQWFFITDTGVLPASIDCKSLEMSNIKQHGGNDRVGFVVHDNIHGRACAAQIVARHRLPIIYGNSLPKVPACLVLKSQLPLVPASAKTWLIAGRGIGAASEFKFLAEVAEQCYARIGATRAIVDLGWADSDQQIGQGGLRPQAEFAIIIGVSGAIQHLEGLKKFKTIIAINPNPKAEIFQVADYGIIATWQEVKPKLLSFFKQHDQGDFKC